MYCSKCGSELSEGVNFCQKCGTSLTQVNESQVSPSVDQLSQKIEVDEPVQNDKKSSGLKKIIFILLGVIIFIVVVIGIIIALLSVLAVSSLDDARMKARDAKRIADTKMIGTSLELYYGEGNVYPSSLYALSEYMSEIPKNPLPNDGDCPADFEYSYKVTEQGESFELVYCLGMDHNDMKAGFNTMKGY